MTEFDKFLLWEATSRDTIDFKKAYVDIANDLIAGLLLSQVIYWYLPDKHGQTKLRVEKEGYLWIAKGRDDWHTEIRISAKQFDRASTILVKKGILIKDYFMFGGFRTIHIRLDYDRFMKLWQEQLESGYIQQRVRPVLPKGQDRNSQKGKTGLPKRVRPLTKNTAKNTTETISPSAENEPPELIQPEHGQSSGDFGDPAKTIPPGEVDVILREGGYDPDEVGARMKAAAERALAEAEISGGPEVSSAPGNVSVFDYIGNITVEMYDLLYEMAKLRLVTTEIRPEYSKYAHFFWADNGKPVESIPLKLAKELGYKPETSGLPENVLVDTRTPYEVAALRADIARSAVETLDKEIMGEEDPETLTDIFGSNPRQQATQPEPETKPKLTEADAAHLQIFGSLPGNETEAFDTIQEIKRSGWEIWDPVVERGIAYCLEAIRSKKPDFAVPNNVSVRKDWNKDVKGHLQDYQADDLKTLYGLAVDKLEKAGMSYTRPGSLTKTLPDVVNEPTATTVIDKDGGFYV